MERGGTSVTIAKKGGGIAKTTYYVATAAKKSLHKIFLAERKNMSWKLFRACAGSNQPTGDDYVRALIKLIN